MKKLVYISFIFAFMMAFTSCEKENFSPDRDHDADIWNTDDGFCGTDKTRGGDGDIGTVVTDPDDDEDFDTDDDEDNIVDPDDDEDFDHNENGIVDPDDDEDFDEDEGK